MLASPRLDQVQVVDQASDRDHPPLDSLVHPLAQLRLRPRGTQPERPHEVTDAVHAQPEQDVHEQLLLGAVVVFRRGHRLSYAKSQTGVARAVGLPARLANGAFWT